MIDLLPLSNFRVSKKLNQAFSEASKLQEENMDESKNCVLTV